MAKRKPSDIPSGRSDGAHADRLAFATYFDRNYLSRGLALYRSLAQHSPQFSLFALCLDEETWRVLSRLQLASLILIPLSELERHDPELPRLKTSRWPLDYYETCTAPLLLTLLEREPGLETITYLDADLFFFSDPSPIFHELDGCSVLLLEHRYRASDRAWAAVYGTYNSGLVAFRRTPEALTALRWWRERCFEWCSFRVEDGRFGNQKYLDDWPARFGGVATIRHQGAGLGPWNVASYGVRSKRGRVLVDEMPLIFYHFSRLRSVNRWLYDPDLRQGLVCLPRTVKHHVYAPYVRELAAASDAIRAVGGTVSRGDGLRFRDHRRRALLNMIKRRSFLIVLDRFVL